MSIKNKEIEEFVQLNAILQKLRSKDGCPWDKEQTPQSLKKNLIEEVYELFDAIDREDILGTTEEVGDVYLVLTMIASIIREEKEDFLHEALYQLNEKLIRRHPHVFGDEEAQTAEAGYAHWKKVKEEELKQGKRPESGGMLSRVGRGQPPLEKAYALQKEVSKVGFHWDSPWEVIDKLQEELSELKEAIEDGHDKDHIQEELGDVLFVSACLAGSLELDVSEALHRANNKFLRRFEFVQNELAKQGLEPNKSLKKEMEEAWQLAKKIEKEEQGGI